MREFQPTSGVYALVDPRSGRTMYVGQARDIEYRYRQHCNLVRSSGNDAVYRWTNELSCLSLQPELVILEECRWPHTDAIERRFIAEFRANGECEFNEASGGMGVRSGSKASRGHPDDWFQLGRKVRRARALLSEIEAEAGRLTGKTRPFHFAKALMEFDRAKWQLEGILCRLFPKANDIIGVFSGPEDEERWFDGRG